MPFLALSWQSALATIAFVLDVAASLHAVLHKRDSRAATAWVGFIWFVPGIGVLLYAIFGLNRIRRRGMELRRARRKDAAQSMELPEWLAGQVRPRLAGLAALSGRLSGRPLVGGNRVEPLFNGDEAYPAMLDAIASARSSVALCSYIFADDGVGSRFVEALAAAKRRGVEVRVLIDDVGVRYNFPPVHWALRRHGVPVARFLPIVSKALLAFFNLRTHRKLLVVDGTVAFAGGMNIAGNNVLADAPRRPVKDTHFRIRGPVVRQLQDAFAEDWEFVTGEVLEGSAWYPPVTQAGTTPARAITAGPDLDFEVMRNVLLGAIAAARHSIRIATPYFLPDTATIAALGVAALRGVRVDIVLPQRGNIPVAHWASRALLWQVLAPGCHVYLSPKPFDHSKLFVIDRSWALFGTTNWDPRSLRLNFELDIECYDDDFAGRMDGLIQERKAHAWEYTLADADGRPLWKRIRDGSARLLSPYL